MKGQALAAAPSGIHALWEETKEGDEAPWFLIASAQKWHISLPFIVYWPKLVILP